LLSELRIHDEDERELKVFKTKNLDKDGEMESIVRKKLLGKVTCSLCCIFSQTKFEWVLKNNLHFKII